MGDERPVDGRLHDDEVGVLGVWGPGVVQLVNVDDGVALARHHAGHALHVLRGKGEGGRGEEVGEE